MLSHANVPTTNRMVVNLSFSKLVVFFSRYFCTYIRFYGATKNTEEMFWIDGGNWSARNSANWAYPMNNSGNRIYFQPDKKENNDLQNEYRIL